MLKPTQSLTPPTYFNTAFWRLPVTSVRKTAHLATRIVGAALAVWLLSATSAWAGEADLAIPNLHDGKFIIGGNEISAWNLLFGGSFVILGTLGFSLYLRAQIKALPAHESMLNIAEIIFQTCKTYLIQQGKFLAMLFLIIAIAMMYYFVGLQHKTVDTALMVLCFSSNGTNCATNALNSAS